MSIHSIIIPLLILTAPCSDGRESRISKSGDAAYKTSPEMNIRIQDRDFLERSSIAISKTRPSIPSYILERDKYIIEESLQHIYMDFRRRGFDDDDVRDAAFSSWFKLRTEKLEPEEQLDNLVFVSYVGRLGKLNISTQPIGATIKIDKYERAEKTDASLWLNAGKYRIKINKDGYLPIDEECYVKELDVTEFIKVLRQKD